ncbi:MULTISPECIES: GNAT family N-acetyltransferase [Siphonobacter]|uniref:N-acetyltransferase n=1 Tax=Siphonobacter curvatus TaxID=2094562 RepID=A0A2S7II99_9BACT|nr:MULTISPECIES: GNAT family N-acetyltransferase [Siphonobacter]PMD90796.1 GNAT family N-acetyltransferase [Siphonobacter sp. BAB-5405]PQA55577.1 N-acetyltransferase [Siphonobacter curvatus]
MDFSSIPLHNNVPIHNYEMVINGHRAFIDYLEKGSKIYLIHTEVPSELEGMGVASALVTRVLEDIESRGLALVPLCPYVQAYLKRHPDWNRLVQPK